MVSSATLESLEGQTSETCTARGKITLSDKHNESLTQERIPDYLSGFPIFTSSFMHRWTPSPNILLTEHFISDLFVKFQLSGG